MERNRAHAVAQKIKAPSILSMGIKEWNRKTLAAERGRSYTPPTSAPSGSKALTWCGIIFTIACVLLMAAGGTEGAIVFVPVLLLGLGVWGFLAMEFKDDAKQQVRRAPHMHNGTWWLQNGFGGWYFWNGYGWTAWIPQQPTLGPPAKR